MIDRRQRAARILLIAVLLLGNGLSVPAGTAGNDAPADDPVFGTPSPLLETPPGDTTPENEPAVEEMSLPLQVDESTDTDDVSPGMERIEPNAGAPPDQTSLTGTPTTPIPEEIAVASGDSSDFAPASIVNDPPDGPECDAPAEAARAAPGGFVRYTCTWTLPALASGSFEASVSPPGWLVSIHQLTPLGPSDGPLPIATIPVTEGSGAEVAYHVDVHVPATAAPDETGITIVSTSCSGAPVCSEATGSVEISTTVDSDGYINAVSSDGYARLSCRPQAPSSYVVPHGGSTVFDCTIGAALDLSLLDITALGLLSFSIDFPEHWSATVSGLGESPVTSDTGTLAVTLDPILDLAIEDGDDFTVTFSAGCDAEGGSVALDSTIGLDLAGPPPPLPGPAISFPLSIAGSAGDITGYFTDADPTLFDDASVTGLDGDAVAGAMTLTIERGSCAAGLAALQVTSTGGTHFDPVGSASGLIPLGNLRLVGINVANPDTGVVPVDPGAGLALTTLTEIATFDSVSGGAAYGVDLLFSLSVPAATEPGVYRAVLTVTFVPGGAP